MVAVDGSYLHHILALAMLQNNREMIYQTQRKGAIVDKFDLPVLDHDLVCLFLK